MPDDPPDIADARPAAAPVPVARHVRRAVRQGLGGTYPSRYHRGWKQPLEDWFRHVARPGMTVLDVGSGVWPTIAAELRPPDTTYVGLDRSRDELDRAPAHAYDETIVADIVEGLPAGLAGRFDLVLSWLVLEHVPDVGAAFAHMRDALRPDGRLYAQLAGRRSVSARLNRALSHPVARLLNGALLGRAGESVFPAVYDRCTKTELEALLAPWRGAEVRPVHAGASYFRFARPLFAAYLGYEEWCLRTGRDDLATYYAVEATR